MRPAMVHSSDNGFARMIFVSFGRTNNSGEGGLATLGSLPFPQELVEQLGCHIMASAVVRNLKTIDAGKINPANGA